MATATQNQDSGPITLINVFEIGTDDVERFLLEWQDRAQFLGRQPGFRSLRLHRALNPDSRFQLVNVAEWDSADALQAATAQDFFQQSTQRSMKEFAVAAHPAIYRVVIEAAAE
jgi:heme oxygenase (mycobilin-producing)